MITVEEKNDIVILYIEGRLEISQALELEEKTNNRIKENKKNYIYDLGQVTYLSSSGIRVFIATLRQLKEMNGRMVLANLNNHVLKTLKIVEMDSLFEIMNSVDEAVKSMGV